MEGSCIKSGGSINQPERGPGDLGIRLASTATRLMIMVLRCTVMVVMPMLDGLFVEGGLLDGGMRSS